MSNPFGHLSARNFMSWEKLEFSFDSGVTMLNGWNEDDQTEEGSGKSSVINALSWCLYGKIPKDAKVDEVIKQGAKGCSVSLTLPEGRTITRSRKPNDLYISDSSGKKVKGKDARETQKLVEETVGLSFEAFCQSVYFAQNYDRKFLTSSQEDKAKILSEIQDLGLFDRARKEVTALLKEEQQKISNMEHEITLAGSRKQDLQHQKDAEERLQQEKQRNHEEKIKVLKKNLQEEEQKIPGIIKDMRAEASNIKEESSVLKELEDQKANLEKVQTAKAEIKAQLSNIETVKTRLGNLRKDAERYAKELQKLQDQKEELENFIKNPTKNCPTCGSLLENQSTEHAEKELGSLSSRQEELESAIKEIASQLQENPPESSELNKALDELKKKERELVDALDKLKEVPRNNRLAEVRIESLGKQKLDLEQRVEKLRTEAETLENNPPKSDLSKIKELEQAIQGLLGEIDTKTNVLQQSRTYAAQLEQLKSGFKEVKSHVFNSCLNEITVKANSYLSELFEIPAKIKFQNDDFKIQTQVELEGQPRSLGLLSGGQSRRFNLAVDLALSDVVKSRKGSKLNFLFLDEYFKDLSETSMYKCLELLQKRKGVLVLIEHNSLFKSVVDKSFNIVLQNGTSSFTHQET